MSTAAITLDQVAVAYRDQLVTAVRSAGGDYVAAVALDVDETAAGLWPRLAVCGDEWRTEVMVVPTSDGVVLDLFPGDGSARRALPTRGRPSGAVLLELLALATPHC